jgi:translocation and assembly module TamB
MPALGRVARRLLIALAGVIATLVLVVAGAIYWLNTETGRAVLLSRVDAALAGTGLSLSVQGLAGRLPYSLAAETLSLSDPAGPWLTIEALELRWQPWALLTGRIRIDALAASSVDLTRLPTLPAPEAASPAEGPDPLDLLLRTRIERLAVARLRLGESLLGEPSVWRIDGEIGAPDPEGVVHRLEIGREDGRADRLDLRVAQDPATATLSLRGEMREAPGGIVLRLLGLDDGRDLALTVVGDGPFEAWEGRLTGQLGDARADIGFGRDGSPPAIRIDGRIDPVGLLPDAVAPLAAGGFELAARVRHDPTDSIIELAGLRLSSEALLLEGRGSYEAGPGRFDAVATVVESIPGAFAPLLGASTTEDLALTLEAAGTLAKPRVGMRLDAGKLALAEVVTGGVALTAEARKRDAEWDFSGRLDAERVAWSLDGSGPLVRGPAALTVQGQSRDGTRLLFEQVELTLPDAEAAGRVEIDLSDGTLDAPLSVTITDLGALAGLTRLDLTGAGRFDVRLRQPSAGPLAVTVDGRTERLAIDLPVVRALVSPAMRVSARVEVAPASGVAIRGARFAGENATAGADLQIPPAFDRLEGDVRVEIPEAAVLAPELGLETAGAAKAAARFDGPLDDPALTGTLDLSTVGVGPLRWSDVTGRFELERLASGLSGPVSVFGRRAGEEARAGAHIELTPSSFDLRGLRASAPGAALAGDLSLPLGDGAIAAELSLSLTDLAALTRGTGLRAGGRGNGLLRLYAEAGGQAGSLKLSAEELRLLRGQESIVFAQALELDARLKGDQVEPGLEAFAQARGLRGPSTDLDALRLSAHGDAGRLEIGLEASGEVLDAPATMTAGVAALLDGDHPVLILERLDGSLAGQPLASRESATLSLRDGGIELTGLALDVGGGSLTGETRIGLPSPGLEVTARELPLALLSLVDPRVDLAGKLSGGLELEGSGPDATGRFELALDPVRLASRRRAVDLRAGASGTLARSRLAFEMEVALPTGTPVRLNGELPLRVDLSEPVVSLPADGRLDASLDWAGDVAEVGNLLPMNDHILRGPTRAGLRLSGTVAAPVIGGEISLEGGYYEHLVAGTVLSPLEMRLVGSGSTLSIERLEGGAGDDGRVSLHGAIELDPGAGFPAALELAFSRARLLRRDELTATADGRITVDGPIGAPAVVGRIDVREVEARLRNNLPPDVAEIEVVEAGDRPESDAPANANGETSSTDDEREGRLDVQIRMPERVFVRGLGIDSEWGGQLQVGGTPRAPTLEGRLELIRGIMIFVGRRFRLEDSAIRFPGGGAIEPEIDVRAVYEGQVYVVTLSVTGPATDTSIKISSQPALPESEILSQALFGKSTGELSALEAVQLATAVAELTGRGGGSSGVVDRLRQTVGIDVLRVGSKETATGEQAASVEAGVYVAEGLYLGAETSTAEDSGAVSVEYEVTKRIRIKTDLDQTGGQNIGVQYKRDY